MARVDGHPRKGRSIVRPPLPLLRALADVLDLGAEAAAAVGLLVVSAVGALPAGPVDVGTRHAAAAVAHR
ncbi:MAG TPA: hypothetical protein VK935_08655, partial [Actinomycetospora sp.]|nr:hypothetical protein [Actinomycetospora sp.]